MGVVPAALARQLRDRLQIERAIETGTYQGKGARALAAIFSEVVTVELDAALHARTVEALAREPAITAVHGNSRDVLPSLVDARRPTFYWLDSHWSGGVTAGEDDECPVLDELRALEIGHPDDCILIDDARLFLAPPPPPHKTEQWPTFTQISAAIRAARPNHHVEVVHDVVIAVPATAQDLVDRYGRRRLRPGVIRRLAARLLRR